MSHARRTLPLLAAAVLIMSLLAAGAVQAEPPPPAARYDPAAARSAGVAVAVTRRRIGEQTLIDATLPRFGSTPNDPVSEARRLLATSRDGGLVASTDSYGGRPGALSIATADGSLVRSELEGVLASAFAADGSWAATIDGAGRMWRVETQGGAATRLADGPFTAPIAFDADGSLLTIAVSSVEAPASADLARVEPVTGRVVRLTAGELLSGFSRLDSGGVAYFVSNPDGSTSVRSLGLGAGGEPLADLGAAAIHVSISATGGQIAFERAGQGVFIQERGAGIAHRISGGAIPRVSPDGSRVMVLAAGGTDILDLRGRRLAHMAGPAVAWAGCGARCDR